MVSRQRAAVLGREQQEKGQQQQQQHEGAAAAKPASARPALQQKQRSRWRLGFAGFACTAVLLAAANLLYPQLLQRLQSSSSDLAGAQLTFAPISQVHSTVIGNKTFKPALGIFPRGCKWRDVVEEGSTAVQYEYWQEAEQQWVQQQPLSCKLQGEPMPGQSEQNAASSWRFHKGNPRTEVVPSKHHVTYRNLWYNNGRWYALVDGPRQVSSWKFSKNQEITVLHVLDAREWAKSTKWRAVRGDTLLFDFIFFIHPTAIGHWWEMMGPLYSVLKQPAVDFKRPCDQMVLLHLKRTHLMEWVRAVVAVALGVGVQQELPPILLQQESNVPWQQLGELRHSKQPLVGIWCAVPSGRRHPTLYSIACVQLCGRHDTTSSCAPTLLPSCSHITCRPTALDASDASLLFLSC
jgi:hypothetical protein